MDDTNVGFYRKFDVKRADGSSAPGRKHEHCSYFVLDLDHDKHAFPAIKAYAKSCREEFPFLSADLRRMAKGLIFAIPVLGGVRGHRMAGSSIPKKKRGR